MAADMSHAFPASSRGDCGRGSADAGHFNAVVHHSNLRAPNLLARRADGVSRPGAGSGRDAAWLAAKGYGVIAVEPCQHASGGSPASF